MFKKIFAMALTMISLALPAMAADTAAPGSYGPIGLGLSIIGFAIAAGMAGLGQGKIGAAALEGTARNPSAAGKIQTMMILGLAFIESLVIFALVIVFAK